MEHLKPRIEDLKANLSLVHEILGKLEQGYFVTSDVIDKKRYALQIREKQQEKLNIEQELRGYGVDIPTLTPSDSTCPYRGLMAFGEKDSANFFGRTATSKALKTLVENYRFVPLSGVSGSGKSSVLFAGLKPLLNDDWLVLDCRPNRAPFYELVQGLKFPNIDPVSQQKAFEGLRVALAKGEIKLAVALDTTRRKHNKPRLLLIIDQFEEIYTLPPKEIGTQKAFIRCIVTAIRQINTHNLPITILLAYRADFTGFMQESFGNLLNRTKTFSLNRMSEAELTEAIERPAIKADGGVFLQDGLLQRILEDVGQDSDRLPLLQLALEELWKKRSDGYLTHEAYDKVMTTINDSGEEVKAKGLESFLTKHADEKLEVITNTKNSQEQENSYSELEVRQIFMQLVSFNMEGTVTRRIATQENIHNWELVKYLADARLVITGQNAAKEQTVEIVHEALIQHWDKLRKWINEDRNFRMWQQGLLRDMRDNALLRDVRLIEAQRWLDERKAELSPEKEIAFIEASVAQHQAELAEKERIQQEREELQQREIEALQAKELVQQERDELQQREIKALQAKEKTSQRAFLGTILALFIVSALGYQTYLERNNALLAAEKEASAKNETQLANTALTNKNDQLLRKESQILSETSEKYLREKNAPVTAMRLALEALPDTSIDNPKRPWVQEAKTALYSAVEQHWRGIWEHDGIVNHVQFSPDGQLVLSSTKYSNDENPSFGNDAYIWEFPSGKLRHVLRGHTQSVNFSYFSPDGKKVLTVSSDGTACVWDVVTGELLLTIHGKFMSLMYDASRAVPAATIFAKFSHDSKLIAVTSSDNEGGATVYECDTGKELFELPLHRQLITSISFSVDDSKILTTSRDNTARIWDSKTGSQLLVLNRDERVFIPDNSDKMIDFLYESPSKDSSNLLVIEAGTIYGEFSPDGRKVVITKNDGRVLLFDTQTGQQLWDFKDKNGRSKLWQAVFSPDGKYLAAGSMGADAHIWHTETGEELYTLKGHQAGISHIGFSSNGKYVVTISAENTVKLWSTQDYKEFKTLTGHIAKVTHAAFSPDGAWLATASYDKTLRIWNTTTGEAFGVLPTPNIRLIAKGNKAITCGKLWSNTGQVLLDLPNTYCGVDYLLTQDESKLLVISDGNLYQTDTGRKLHTFPELGINGYTIFSPDDKRLITVRENDIYVFDVSTGNKLLQLTQDRYISPLSCLHKSIENGLGLPNHHCIASSYNGNLILFSFDNIAVLWNTESNRSIELSHPEKVTHVAITPDGTQVITAVGNSIYIWSTTGKQLKLLSGDSKIIALTVDGKILVTATIDRKLHVWDMNTSNESMSMSGHVEPVWDIWFSENKEKIYSYGQFLSSNAEIRVWDTKTGRALGEQTCDIYRNNQKDIEGITVSYKIPQDGYSEVRALNKYCIPQSTKLFTMTTNTHFYWLPSFFENNVLIDIANQFVRRHEWSCIERRKFQLIVDQCSNKSLEPSDMNLTTLIVWRLAMTGNVSMQYNIGMKYANGQGVPVDIVKSAEWVHKSAENGHAAAQTLLGLYYLQGTGVKKDNHEAQKWFLKSAEQGVAQAQMMLCRMYSIGDFKGFDLNGNEALKWCRKAVDNNRIDKTSQEIKAEASYAMGILYQTGRGVKRSFEAAVSWHKKAYALGKKNAVTQLKVTKINPDKLTNAQSERLGLQVGDTFTEYDGKPVINTDYLVAYREAESVGSPPKELKVLRNGQILIFPISPGKIGIDFEDIQ